MLKRKLIAFLLIGVLALTGCGSQGGSNNSNSGNIDANNNESALIDTENIFSKRDYKTEYEENCTSIKLKGTSATCDSNAVEIKGSTITILDEGTYVISGSLENGMIIVNSEDVDKTQIVLKGASIHNEKGAAIYVKQADKVFLTLEKGTENTLSSGKTFDAMDGEEIDGVVYSMTDITLNGEGSLEIKSPGAHGIVSKDDLLITGGNYMIDSATHGLAANDMLGFAGGTFNIVSGEDSLHCDTNIYVKDGSFEINSKDDAVHADATLLIGGGKINITNSYEGLEALNIEILDGDIRIVSSDDGLNAAGGTDNSGYGGMDNGQFGGQGGQRPGGGRTEGMPEGMERPEGVPEGMERPEGMPEGMERPEGGRPEGQGGRPGGQGGAPGGQPGEQNDMQEVGGMGGPGGMMGGSSDGSVRIAGGTLYVKASGDGIDANGTLEITGGSVTICGPTQGDTATLDYDMTGVINGGTFIGTGGTMMAQSFNDSKQGVIAVKVGNQAAGTQITLKDSSGKELLSATPELPFAIVILSSPQIEKGETYTITVGSETGEFEAQ